MIIAYLLRLGCLSLAAWFLVHLVCGLAVAAFTPRALRTATRRSAADAARILLAVRLAPLTCSLLVVALFCVPSYLWLEPQATSESVGVGGAIAALLGLSVMAESVYRGTRAALHSRRFSRRCRLVAREEVMAGGAEPVLVLDQNPPCLALVGIVRPRVVLARSVLTALSAEELSAALAHERAHRDSWDNVKRLAVLSAPGLLPFICPFRRLDREWARFTEWAADDAAAAGDPFRPVTLAGALVRFARLGTKGILPAAATSMLDCHRDLAERVERLLNPRPLAAGDGRVEHRVRIGIALSAAALLFAALPVSLPLVHRMLEQLMD